MELRSRATRHSWNINHRTKRRQTTRRSYPLLTVLSSCQNVRGNFFRHQIYAQIVSTAAQQRGSDRTVKEVTTHKRYSEDVPAATAQNSMHQQLASHVRR
jgi:hypothetical protein